MDYWTKITEIVDQARRLADPNQAESFIRRACADDEVLREDCLRTYRFETRSARSRDPMIGRVFGKFELVEFLGRGGMGVVYLARQHGLRGPGERVTRHVAIKLFPVGGTDPDTQGIQRFTDEVDNVLSLQHPNIVNVITSGGDDGSDYLWFAMEYIDGHDLAKEIGKQRDIRDGRKVEGALWPPYRSLEYTSEVVCHIARVAAALDHAHHLPSPIVHRDIKPQNILLRLDGSPVIADFGLAKVKNRPTITRPGAALGTLHYMSPEQASVQKIMIDERSDIYSLGVVLYECLSLCLPITDEANRPQALLSRIASADVVALHSVAPHVPRDLSVICHKCLSRRPSDRYPSAGELSVELHRFLRREAIIARPLSLWRRGVEWIRRHPRRAATLAAAGLILIAAWASSIWSERRTVIEYVQQRVSAALALGIWEGHEATVIEAYRALRDVETRPEVADALMAHSEDFWERHQRVLDNLKGTLSSLPGTRSHRVETHLGIIDVPPQARDLILLGARATRALPLFPDDGELLELAEVLLFSNVTITLNTPHGHEARAFALPVDLATGLHGPAIPLGPLPVAAELPAGDYRFVVDVPDYGIAEYDRRLDLGETLELGAQVRREIEVLEDMIFLDSTTFQFTDIDGPKCAPTRDEVTVHAFYICPATVTNAEYIEFLEATGHRPPLLWRDIGGEGNWRTLSGLDSEEAQERFKRLPATGMGHEDMQAYAEWAGMRLPTHFELEYALRGPDRGRVIPEDAHIHGPRDTDARLPLARFEQYLSAASPSASPAHRQGPFGLFHVYGNVKETTSTTVAMVQMTDPQPRRLQILPIERIYLGGAWDAERDGWRPEHHGFAEYLEGAASPSLGFRCARGANALP